MLCRLNLEVAYWEVIWNSASSITFFKKQTQTTYEIEISLLFASELVYLYPVS